MQMTKITHGKSHKHNRTDEKLKNILLDMVSNKDPNITHMEIGKLSQARAPKSSPSRHLSADLMISRRCLFAVHARASV